MDEKRSCGRRILLPMGEMGLQRSASRGDAGGSTPRQAISRSMRFKPSNPNQSSIFPPRSRSPSCSPQFPRKSSRSGEKEEAYHLRRFLGAEATNRPASITHSARASGPTAGAFATPAGAGCRGAGFPSEVSTLPVLAAEERISATSFRSTTRSYVEVIKSPNMGMPLLSKVVDAVVPPLSHRRVVVDESKQWMQLCPPLSRRRVITDELGSQELSRSPPSELLIHHVFY
jgi:hypothetical protein